MAGKQSLAGRVAVITGAASGMGRVMARALAGAGAKITGVDVDAASLDRLAEEPVFAGKFLKAVADVSKTADCRHAVDRAVDTFGALDILINCAGISMSTAASDRDARIKFFEADPQGLQRILAVNAIGAFLMARFAARPMIARGWGRIIVVTTSFDTMLAPGMSAYGASKAALEASCVSFAKDLEGRYILVNTACANFLGKSKSEILGCRDADLYSAESARQFVEDDRQVLKAGTTMTFEGVAKGSVGDQSYRVTKGVVRDEHGAVVGVFGISHDMTERRRA